MLDGNVAAFTSECQFQLTQDVNNYDTDHHGNLILRDDVKQVCSSTCLRHGRCVLGQCVCESGYKGDNCQLRVGQAPHLLRVRKYVRLISCWCA